MLGLVGIFIWHCDKLCAGVFLGSVCLSMKLAWASQWFWLCAWDSIYITALKSTLSFSDLPFHIYLQGFMWDWDKSNLVIALVSACPAFLPFASNKLYCAFLLEDHCQCHVVLVLVSILIPLGGTCHSFCLRILFSPVTMFGLWISIFIHLCSSIYWAPTMC